MRSFPLLLAAAAALFLCAPLSEAANVGAVSGGWSPIKDLSDPHVVEIANFGLSEHNKEATNGKLELSKIVKGESQVVAGTNYKLVIQTNDGGDKGVSSYELVVWEKVWQNFRKLVSFKPLSN